MTNQVKRPEAVTLTGYENVLVEQIGAIARISHNRPAQRNAENTLLLDEMDRALSWATANPEVRVIVIGGVGDHFSAGHDLKEAMTERANYTVEQRWDYEETRYYGYCLRIYDCPKPTIAQVQGACIGGAFMVANMCDLMVASEEAYFADPVLRTLAAASIEVLVHPWVMGMRRAKEFLYLSERMTAVEGHRIGMVNCISTRANLEEETLVLAERLAEAPPFAIRLLKRSLQRTADIQGFRNALSAHFDTHQVTHVTEETRLVRQGGHKAAIQNGRSSPST